jgi:hypothetical protein
MFERLLNIGRLVTAMHRAETNTHTQKKFHTWLHMEIVQQTFPSSLLLSHVNNLTTHNNAAHTKMARNTNNNTLYFTCLGHVPVWP